MLKCLPVECHRGSVVGMFWAVIGLNQQGERRLLSRCLGSNLVH